MSRPRQYNRDEVLSKSTELFWEKGFEATSMNQVANRTGVNKYSIYNEFGNKEKLFLACIDYFLLNHCFVEEILSKEPLGLKNIEAFFEYKVRSFYSEVGRGCLIFNSLDERDTLGKSANVKIDDFISKIKVLFHHCLNAAQERKEISKNKDCEALANYLLCFTFGLVNLGMRKMNKQELSKTIELALLVIRN